LCINNKSLHIDVEEMIGRECVTNLVTSSNRRRVSAFGIDELLGLSRRDVIVTSVTPPSQSATVSSAEGQPPVNRAAVPCCCRADVEDWTDTSSDTFRASFGLSSASSHHSFSTDVGRPVEQHRPGKTLSRIERYLRAMVSIIKTGPLWSISPLHQFTTFRPNRVWHRGTLFNVKLTTMTFLNRPRTSCVVSITTVATWHTRTANLWANFQQRIVDRAITSAKRLCACVSTPKDCTSNACNFWHCTSFR